MVNSTRFPSLLLSGLIGRICLDSLDLQTPDDRQQSFVKNSHVYTVCRYHLMEFPYLLHFVYDLQPKSQVRQNKWGMIHGYQTPYKSTLLLEDFWDAAFLEVFISVYKIFQFVLYGFICFADIEFI